jgi:enoyl-CoA hydratase
VLAADALPEADAYTRELELGMEVMASQDAREGPRAFLDKREPDFTGR